jgi:hypothetical protein
MADPVLPDGREKFALLLEKACRRTENSMPITYLDLVEVNLPAAEKVLPEAEWQRNSTLTDASILFPEVQA